MIPDLFGMFQIMLTDNIKSGVSQDGDQIVFLRIALIINNTADWNKKNLDIYVFLLKKQYQPQISYK